MASEKKISWFAAVKLSYLLFACWLVMFAVSWLAVRLMNFLGETTSPGTVVAGLGLIVAIGLAALVGRSAAFRCRELRPSFDGALFLSLGLLSLLLSGWNLVAGCVILSIFAVALAKLMISLRG